MHALSSQHPIVSGSALTRQLRSEARAESVFRSTTLACAVLVLVLLASIIVSLIYGGLPALKAFQ